MPHVKTRMTVVRMAVAKLELMSATPSLARIAVSAAKSAERRAQPNQFMSLRLESFAPNRQPCRKMFLACCPGSRMLLMVLVSNSSSVYPA